MTTEDRDFEDMLRGALRAAAESIEPVGDGLQKIRHRLDSPRSASSVLAGAIGWLRLSRIRLGVRLEPATEAGRAALGQLGDAFGASAPGRGTPGRGHARRRQPHGRLRAAGPWMRPALAVSAVVAVVVVGFVTLRTVQQAAFTPTNSVTSPGGHHGAAHPGSTTTYSQGGWPLSGTSPGQEPTGYASQGGASSTTPLATCPPTPRPTASKARPSSSPGRTPAPTPSPSSSSFLLPTPSATVSTPPAMPSPTGSPALSPGTSPGASRRSNSSGDAAATTASVRLAPEKARSCGSGASPTPEASKTHTSGA